MVVAFYFTSFGHVFATFRTSVSLGFVRLEHRSLEFRSFLDQISLYFAIFSFSFLASIVIICSFVSGWFHFISLNSLFTNFGTPLHNLPLIYGSYFITFHPNLDLCLHCFSILVSDTMRSHFRPSRTPPQPPVDTSWSEILRRKQRKLVNFGSFNVNKISLWLEVCLGGGKHISLCYRLPRVYNPKIDYLRRK